MGTWVSCRAHSLRPDGCLPTRPPGVHAHFLYALDSHPSAGTTHASDLHGFFGPVITGKSLPEGTEFLDHFEGESRDQGGEGGRGWSGIHSTATSAPIRRENTLDRQ
jgi:hypothetical protein